MPPISSEAEFDRNADSIESYQPPKISRDYDFTLVAGTVVPMQVDGSTIYVKEATNDVDVTFYPAGRTITLKQGQGFDAGPYDSVRIVSTVGQTVTLSLGHGAFQDNRFISTTTVSATVEMPDTVATPVDVTIAFGVKASVSAARATKRQTLLSNTSALASVRVGPTAVDATRGISVAPGASLVVDGSMELFAHNTHASASATIEVMELDKV